MTSPIKTCEDLAQCMVSWVVSDHFDLPNLIGDRYGLATGDFRTHGILYPLATNVASYLFLWSKCHGESRNYANMPDNSCTKWSITKIFTFSGPVVIVSQMWASIPYSIFNFPSDAYLSYYNQLHYYTHISFYNYTTSDPINDLLNDNEFYEKRYVDASNTNLRDMPSWLGKVAFIYSLIVSAKVLGSCYANKRIGKRDALMLSIQTASLVYSLYLIFSANQIDFGPYLNADLEGCKAQYLTKPPANKTGEMNVHT